MLLYLSYRRHDRDRVRAIATHLEELGMSIWWDDMLRAGDAFERQLSAKLAEADVVVSFLTRNSVSALQQREEFMVARKTGKRILPVLLDEVSPEDVPFAAQTLWLDASLARSPEAIAALIASAVHRQPAAPASPAADSGSIAEIAKLVREHTDTPAAAPGAAHSVFIVHGHDDGMKNEVSAYLRSVDVTPVILKDLDTRHPTLFNKFEEVGREAKYAIVLVSSDDFGTSLLDYNDTTAGGPGTLEYRARQNVILELGFFFGKLGWDNVFILEKAPPTVRPRFDMPSDLRGVVTRNFDPEGGWKERLLEQLRAKGLAR